MSGIIHTCDPGKELDRLTHGVPDGALYAVIPDSCAPILLNNAYGRWSEHAIKIPIPDGESAKNLQTAEIIWQALLKGGATRQSVLINIGGGMTTDIGGFAAACYMRGIRYINVPTTLLAMVDASTGGKTGLNLGCVKNVVGAFHNPDATIVSPVFLKSLPYKDLLSGYGEMLKHALIKDKRCIEKYLSIDPQALDETEWSDYISESVNVKRNIVSKDPYEKGLRRILNLGHTAGHAIEALCMDPEWQGVRTSHGHAVAWGLVSALVLSHIRHGFSSELLQKTALYIRRLYPQIPIKCDHYPRLLELMGHDKKNPQHGIISFVLLRSPGDPVLSDNVPIEEIHTALDITRDLLGI